MDDHIFDEHNYVNCWNCPLCSDVGFSTQFELLYHRDMHHSIGKFKCSVNNCQFVADRRIKVISHFDKIHPNQENVFESPTESRSPVELPDQSISEYILETPKYQYATFDGNSNFVHQRDYQDRDERFY